MWKEERAIKLSQSSLFNSVLFCGGFIFPLLSDGVDGEVNVASAA